MAQEIHILIKTLILAGILSTTSLHADTTTLSPTKDNTLYESNDGTLSNGGGFYLFAGTTAGNDKRRAVLHFDLSSIPAGSTVNSANLVLQMDKTIAGAATVNAHRLLADWGEAGSVGSRGEGGGGSAQTNDATWLHSFFSTTSWTSAGGDFTAAASASQTLSGTGSYTWTSTQLNADVQAWIDSAANNFGWILIGDESKATTTKRFLSRNSNDASLRPQLVVDYTAAAVNNAPAVANAITDISLTSGETFSRALNSAIAVFSDPDGDVLSYSATSSDTTVATVSIADDTLRVVLVGASSATISLRSDDGRGGVGTASFKVQLSSGIIDDPEKTFVGDFNGDNIVDFNDFFSFADHFGLTTAATHWDARYDFDADNDVDFDDFFTFADNFGKRKD